MSAPRAAAAPAPAHLPAATPAIELAPAGPPRAAPADGHMLVPFAGRNVLTFDVEDYFHANGLACPSGGWDALAGRVEYNTRRLLRILQEHDTRATFFVLGWVAERYPGLVRAIHDAGHEIASHGSGHRLVYEQDAPALRADLLRAKAALEDLTGAPVLGYRAPSFSVTPSSAWALEVIAETGHAYDSSIFPIRRQRYGDPHAPRHAHRLHVPGGSTLLEIPPSTVRLGGRNVPVAGGGFFRAFPLAFTRWAIARLNAHEGVPAVVYLHPWEIDPDQPRMPTTAGNRFRHYLNLHRTEERLRRLLRELAFAPAREVAAAALAPAHEPARGLGGVA